MSKRIFSGYQVRSKDLTGISFTDWNLETCKRYCRKGDVIVSTYWKKFGIDIRISWIKWFMKTMRRKRMSNGINRTAHEYAVNATKAAIYLIREPDISKINMKLFSAKDLEEAFKAGTEWTDKK